MSESERQHDESLSASDWQEVYDICDRFEAAWQQPQPPPRIEDFLVADWPRLHRRTLLRDLLIVELNERLARGEQPQANEYKDRFSDFKEAIDDAFAAQDASVDKPHEEIADAIPASHPTADWHLLFGLLAMQNGLITHAQLVSAFARWINDKSTPLDELLSRDGAINAAKRDTLRQLVELHVQQHQGDPQQSLMALSGSDLQTVRSELNRLDDPDVQHSIAHLTEVDPAATAPPTVGHVTSGSGRFRILRPLPGARGGMGEISVARDEELGRQVALKQILGDKANQPAYRQKFQVEAEITGNLEHPGIVPIYGLGAGADGRPYYAMRLVHGDNLQARIKQFHEAANKSSVDYNSVEFRGLIDRLIDVAQAIRYAHSRGVLHRDLKPGNILVGEYGETLVIDWGLARLPQTEEDGSSSDTTTRSIDAKEPLQVRSGSHVDATMQGQALGTVGYAPPEQLNGRIDLISRRSDVYALSAILYQILVGRAPIDTKRTDRNLGDLIKETVEGQITPPREIDRSVPKALSAICMKGLAREPDDRYRSAGALIDEIEAWKADQPIAAAPDSLADRVLRLARRYRAAALAISATLLGIAVVASVALVVVDRARIREKQALAKESEARTEAETLAARNQAVVDAFVDAFRSPDPENEGVTSNMTALEVLDQALARVEGDDELQKDPITKGRLLQAIGFSLQALGAYSAAISSLESSRDLLKAKFGPHHPNTLLSMRNLAIVYRMTGRLEDALLLQEETLKLTKAKFGPDHSDTMGSMSSLAVIYASAGRLADALLLQEETLKLKTSKLGPDHPDTLGTMHNLAVAYAQAGRLDDALPLFQETFKLMKAELGRDHPNTLLSMNGLAVAYASAGRWEEALQLNEEALKLREAKLGPDHPDTLATMHNLANAYAAAGRLEQALPLHEETLKLKTSKLGPDHPNTLLSKNSLANAYRTAGRLDDALPLYEDTFRLMRAKLGPNHPDTLATMHNVADAYRSSGRLEDAVPLLEKTLKLKKAKLGPNHPDTLLTVDSLAVALLAMSDLAEGYRDDGRMEDAITLQQETLEMMKASIGDMHPNTLQAMEILTADYFMAGRLTDGLTLSKDLFRLTKAKLGEEHPDTLKRMVYPALFYEAVGQPAVALQLYSEILGLHAKVGRAPYAATLTRSQELMLQTELFEGAKQSAEIDVKVLQGTELAQAEVSLAESLLGLQLYADAGERVNAALDNDDIQHTQRLRANSIKGAVFAADARWDEAEPLVVKAAEEFAQQLADLKMLEHWYVPRAHDRVIAMYEAWGKPDKVAEWETRLTDVNAEIERLRNGGNPPKCDAPADDDLDVAETTD